MRKLLILLVVSLLAGAIIPTAAQDDTYSYIFVNLTNQTVDLYVNGQPAFLGMDAGQVTDERVRGVSPDSAELYIENGNRADPDSALAAANMTPEAGDSVILVAYDTADGVEMVTITRNLTALPANLGRLQVVNLGAELPAISLTAQNAETLVTGLAYGETFEAEIPGGNYQVEITGDEGSSIGAASILAEPGVSITMLVYGADSARTLQITDRAEQMALLRVVHAGRITPPLDIYLDGERIIENVRFGTGTDYITVTPGTYTVDLYETGAAPGSDSPLFTGSLQVGTGYPVTAVAMGEANLRLIPHIDNIQQLPENHARAKVIHAATNMPLLDVFEGESRLVGSLEYALSSPNFNIDAGTHQFRFAEANAETYATLENYEMQPHHIYTFVIVGNALVGGSVQVIPLVWHWQGE